MESLNFPDNKLAPSALIESFTTSSSSLHGLLGRLLFSDSLLVLCSSPLVPAPPQESLSGDIFVISGFRDTDLRRKTLENFEAGK